MCLIVYFRFRPRPFFVPVTLPNRTKVVPIGTDCQIGSPVSVLPQGRCSSATVSRQIRDMRRVILAEKKRLGAFGHRRAHGPNGFFWGGEKGGGRGSGGERRESGEMGWGEGLGRRVGQMGRADGSGRWGRQKGSTREVFGAQPAEEPHERTCGTRTAGLRGGEAAARGLLRSPIH